MLFLSLELRTLVDGLSKLLKLGQAFLLLYVHRVTCRHHICCSSMEDADDWEDLLSDDDDDNKNNNDDKDDDDKTDG